MTDYTYNSFGASIKSLEDVVGPSIKQDDPLANEQLKLSVDYIRFIRERLDFIHLRVRYDLKHHIKMAQELFDKLSSNLPDEICGDVRKSIDYGSSLLKEHDSSLSDLRGGAAILAHLCCRIIDILRDGESQDLLRAEKIVMKNSMDRVTMERSWYAPLGFDPDSATLDPLDSILNSI